MIIQIDTDQKIVTIKERTSQNLSKLVKELKKMLGDEWKEYAIDSGYNPWWYSGTTYVPTTRSNTDHLTVSDHKMTTN